MRSLTLATLCVALAACQGVGDPDTEFAASDAPAAGQLGKADGAVDCAALEAQLEALLARAAQGDRRAALQAESVARQLAFLEEAGECAAEAPQEMERVRIASAQKACAVDVDGDGLLDVDELFGADAPRECTRDEVLVRCPPAAVRGVEPIAPERRATHEGTAGLPRFPAFFPASFMENFMKWLRSLKIHERDYDAEDYDCDDFASDLEEEIEAVGAEAGLPGVGTFTYVACNLQDGNYTTAHALTDVHIAGQIFWVEPQTAQIANLDSNGDGVVTYVTDFSSYPTPTEANDDPSKACFVAVFDSAAAAEAAGLVLD